MAPRTIQEAYDLALRHHQAGRLEDAERHYQRVLARQPKHAGALQHLGIIAQQRGQSAAAVDWIGRAIAAKADVPEAYYNLGIALNELGRREEAIAAYRQAIALKPEYARALNNLGNVLKDQGEVEEAIEVYGRVIALKPDLAEAYNNLGVVLHEKGRFEEAVAACRQAVALRPDYAEAHCNLGNALKARGRLDEAVVAYRQAIAIRPDYAEAHSNLGVVLGEQGRLDEAVAACRRAISLKPEYSEAHSNLGVVLSEQGQVDEAIAACRQAIDLWPKNTEAYNNLGNGLKDQGRYEEAIAAYRQSIAMKPDFPNAHFNLALALLLRGNLEQGWLEHEWRWKVRGLQPPRPFSQPLWRGQDPTSKTILLHVEQGFGDAIQFMRYVPLLAARGAQVVLEVPAELKRLAERLQGVIRIVECGQPLPPFDLQCPLLSLPLAFKTTLESIPADVPYLSVDPALVESWRQKPALAAAGIKIGVVWAGNPQHKNDRNRSVPLVMLAPLATVQGIQFHSLQKGPASAANTPPGMQITHWADELGDFAAAAALIAQLDLVISVDTAIAHLAGAMAKQVWLLLPFDPDWRWLLDRQDSPWYPTMRLFRQTSAGDWPGVIARVARALASLADAQKPAVI